MPAQTKLHRRSSPGSELKKQAAKSLAQLIKDGMVFGLGSGTTIAYAVQYLGERMRSGELREIICIPSSLQSRELALAYGIQLGSLDEYPDPEVAIDGADQADRDLNLIKGGGGAHLREKILAYASRRFAVGIEQDKLVEKLNRPVPIEVAEFGLGYVIRALRDVGGKPELRKGSGKLGPVISDNGNPILDVDFGVIQDPAGLSSKLDGIPGILAHGIFTNPVELHLATPSGIEILRK